MAGKIRITKENVEAAAKIAVGLGSAVLAATDSRKRNGVLRSVAKSAARAAVAQAMGQSQTKPPAAPRSKPAGDAGVVYLLKAGPHFKIGKAKDFERRRREIKLQLPFPVETIHLIQCRNITRTEAFWHRRFAHRRCNGEWFALTEAEVAEFKSRQQM